MTCSMCKKGKCTGHCEKQKSAGKESKKKKKKKRKKNKKSK